jgi:hypothetical protein
MAVRADTAVEIYAPCHQSKACKVGEMPDAEVRNQECYSIDMNDACARKFR